MADPFLSWSFVISTEVILVLGINSACVPYLKTFVQSINSGMIGNDDIRRRGGDSTILYKYATKTKSYSRKKNSNLLSNRGENSVLESCIADKVFPPNLKGIAFESNSNQIISRNDILITADRDEMSPDWEAGSQSSRAKIIHHTSTFAVGSQYVSGWKWK